VKRRIHIIPAADRDIAGQAEYLTQHQNLQMGLRFYNAAKETFRLLAGQPEMGRRAECRSSFLQGMRMFPMKRFPNHLVFYRRVENAIEIVRVLHGARDIETLFEHGEGGSEEPGGADQTGEVT